MGWLKRDERGLTTVEYALLGALVALASITAFESLGTNVGAKADEAAETLGGGSTSAGGGPTLPTPATGTDPGAGAPDPSTFFPGLDAPQSQSSETSNDNPGMIPNAQGWSGDP